MFVNNEIGTVQNIYDIEDIIGDTHALFHVDAVQAIGHLDLDFHNFKIDTMSISAHKFGGPKGVGLLLVKEHTPIAYNQLVVNKKPNVEQVQKIYLKLLD